MPGPRMDGAGLAKMKTLEEATLLLQRVHGLVEMYAVAVKNGQASSPLVMNIRRTLPTLSENLKTQFGMIADQVMQVQIASTRGSSEVMRVRTLREGVAQIKQALEIATAQTKDKHTIKDENATGQPSAGAS